MTPANLRILLIDDDKDDYTLTKERLDAVEGAAYQVDWVPDYDRALETLRRNDHDVCLLDYHLGPRDGLKLLREAVADGCKAPIIMLTGTGNRKVDLEAMEAGADDYLVKSEITASTLEHGIRYAIERKHAQEALTRTADELTRSNKELDQFARIVSHDLQEPLRMVSSYLQILEKRYKGRLDEEADEFIHYAVDGAKRMQTLILDLLAFSRISGRPQPMALTDCANTFKLATANLQAAIQESGAQVTHEALPTVMADASQLLQLFQNLLGNAIKFRGKDAPVVQMRAERRGDEWLFSVRDNGIGIDPAQSDRIFVVFQRLHPREQYPGTGIGLAICKKVVERHGGRIWIESQPGQGSTFYFTFPAQEAPK